MRSPQRLATHTSPREWAASAEFRVFEQALLELIERASQLDPSTPPSHLALAPIAFRPITVDCVLAAAERQALDPLRVLAVLKTEGGRIGRFTPNPNGSYDIGPMQINTVQLSDLSKMYEVGPGKIAQLLAYDGCFNVSVGAWLLRIKTDEVGGDFWRGIGRYRSKNPSVANPYILRVHRNMKSMVLDEKTPGPAHPSP